MFFFGILKVMTKIAEFRDGSGSGPDPLVRSTDPRFRIRTKISRISNNARNQCGGSGMFIPDPGSDFFPSRIPDPNCLHPGSRIPDPHCTTSNRPFLSKETPAAYATHRKSEQRRKRHRAKYTGLRPRLCSLRQVRVSS